PTTGPTRSPWSRARSSLVSTGRRSSRPCCRDSRRAATGRRRSATSCASTAPCAAGLAPSGPYRDGCGGVRVTGVGVPELSVVIAAFDARATLGEQLDALAARDVDFAVEVLVCDNGSRDGTPDLVRRRQEREPWLRLVDASARRGPSAARNIGAGQAAGRVRSGERRAGLQRGE